MNPEELLRVTEACWYQLCKGSRKHNLACITNAQLSGDMALGVGAQPETPLEQSKYREIMKNRLQIPVLNTGLVEQQDYVHNMGW